MADSTDMALGLYFKLVGYNNYYDKNGCGKFKNYIIKEKINNEILMAQELGDRGNPNDCLYSTYYNDKFPIPNYLNIIQDSHKQQFKFYVIQYCYKYGLPPDHLGIYSFNLIYILCRYFILFVKNKQI